MNGAGFCRIESGTRNGERTDSIAGYGPEQLTVELKIWHLFLSKAAAIVNIAAAALIYVGCSGDDGKDGAPGPAGTAGTSCVAQPSVAVPGGFDIVCGTTVVTTLTNGPQGIQGPQGPQGIQGEPGTAVGACTGALVEGGVNIYCGGEFVGLVQNGATGPAGPQGPAGGTGPGGPGTGTCSIAPVALGFDSGIEISCASGEAVQIIICPNGNGLFTNTVGEDGYCDDDGNVAREGGLLRCGGEKFNLTREFCQRTYASGANAGLFINASLNAQGEVVLGTPPATGNGYPKEGVDILGDQSAYNKAEGNAAVTSVKMPLCGYTLLAGEFNTVIGPSNAIALTVPNPRDTADVRKLHAGRVYSGKQICARNLVKTVADINLADLTGSARIDKFNPSNPNSDVWKVLDSALAYYSVKYAGNEAGDREALRDFYFAADKLPYTQCPPIGRNVVSLDNYKCVERSECLYHSNIDNTCYQTAAIAEAVTVTTAVSGAAGTGVAKYPIGTNKWAKACRVQSYNGFAYYAVNDPSLVIEEGTPILASDGTTITGYANAGCPESASDAALSVEKTFKCTGSDVLSVNNPAFAGQSYANPLYCQTCTSLNGSVTGSCGGFGAITGLSVATASLPAAPANQNACNTAAATIEAAIEAILEVSSATVAAGMFTADADNDGTEDDPECAGFGVITATAFGPATADGTTACTAASAAAAAAINTAISSIASVTGTAAVAAGTYASGTACVLP